MKAYQPATTDQISRIMALGGNPFFTSISQQEAELATTFLGKRNFVCYLQQLVNGGLQVGSVVQRATSNPTHNPITTEQAIVAAIDQANGRVRFDGEEFFRSSYQIIGIQS